MAKPGSTQVSVTRLECPQCQWRRYQGDDTDAKGWKFCSNCGGKLNTVSLGERASSVGEGASRRFTSWRLPLVVAVCVAVCISSLVVSFVRAPDASEAKRADSAVADVEPSFDPKDVKRTKKWLAEITKPYIKAARELNAYSISEAEAAIRLRLEEIPTGSTISWTAKVLAVEPTEVYLDWDNEPDTHFQMRLAPDDHWEMVPIGECITLESARSLKSGDLLVVTGTLSELTAYFRHDDYKDTYARYDAVITNASVVPAK